ncbi:MAG: SDR family oxidoreductase [Acidimicrobiia bacterium]|nr:SDR family oxidoreductase [Acidimicrobiia bacterium]
MTLERFRLDGRAAIVTGSGRGIGAAIAVAFAEAGADVVLAARTASQLNDVATLVRDHGREALTVAGDLDDRDALALLVTQATDAFGRLDIVVNNIGGWMPTAFLDVAPGDIERAFHFNVATAFDLTQLAAPHLLATSGNVVNITSAIGRFPERGFALYGTVKAALIQLTRNLARDLAPRVRVNAIAPGAIATAALEIVTSSPELEAAMVAATPMRRIGAPADIAAAALYLASDAASYVTGKVIEVDGGIEASNLPLGLPDLEAPHETTGPSSS